jgi:branched-chain amino acid transport system permease protein
MSPDELFDQSSVLSSDTARTGKGVVRLLPVIATLFGVGTVIFFASTGLNLTSNYIVHVLTMLGIYLLLAHSLNLFSGFTGLTSFCHAIFFSVGAYAYALLRLDASPTLHTGNLMAVGELSFVPAFILAGLIATAVSLVLGSICLRFRGEHFVFATVGFQMIGFVIFCHCDKFTGGQFGIYGIPRPSLFGYTVIEPWHYSFLIGGCVAVVLTILMVLYRSPFGLALQMVREDERGARSLGVDTNRAILLAFALSGGIAGLAGALYSSYITYIDPSVSSLQESILLVTLLMLGGRGNFKGPCIGSLAIMSVPELLRYFGLPNGIAANLREIFYGVILIALIFSRPQGLAGPTVFKV